MLWKYRGHDISFVKILRHVAVVTIFSKLLSNQFFTSQNKILKVPIGLAIVFWFSQVFRLILMLLKNISYLFKAFFHSGEIDFFSSPVQQFFFLICYVFYIYIYIKGEYLDATIIFVCSTCIVSPATFCLAILVRWIFFLLKYTIFFILFYLYIKIANALRLQYFWFVQLALFHQLLFFFFWMCKVTIVLLHYFWFVLFTMLHKIIKYLHNKLAQYFHNFLGVNFL